mmetsp:Transcript_25198/g.79739  ORF Transcript_25198/g.79739 Transcript_25198/m.79739 type:complete len:441 (+) Transcript_25198:140-1462(+)
MWSKHAAAGALALVVLVALAGAGDATSSLVARWKAVAEEVGQWSPITDDYTYQDLRLGQICDVYRTKDDDPNVDLTDNQPGCVVIWAADPTDNFTTAHLPLNQQNNFLNTQHYEAAWNFDRAGFKAKTLPRANEDIDPVCYILNVNGTIALGYEEGNGDGATPCPSGVRGAFPFTEEEITTATPEQLAEMCSMCYSSVCSAAGSRDPKSCNTGARGAQVAVGANAGTNNDITAELVGQATPSYHCHLTLADDSACDYVQWDQHEESRDYYMQYGVLCGWENVRKLNITYCDCTREAGRANGCGREEGHMMALQGVVCGNCNGVSESRTYDMIFGITEDSDSYSGACARAYFSNDPVDRMLCSKGMFCRDGQSITGSDCRDHCSMYKDLDCRCPDSAAAPCPDDPAAPARKLLELDSGSSADSVEPSILSAPIRGNRRMMM